MGVEELNLLKDFLADRPEWAFLALSVGVNTVLFGLLMRSHKAQLAIVARVLPLADRLADLLQTASAKAVRRRKGD